MRAHGNLRVEPPLTDSSGVIMLAGLVMAAEGDTTFRHSKPEIAGGHRELAILLLLVRWKKIRIVVSPAK